jgi:hypothetical protein
MPIAPVASVRALSLAEAVAPDPSQPWDPPSVTPKPALPASAGVAAIASNETKAAAAVALFIRAPIFIDMNLPSLR